MRRFKTEFAFIAAGIILLAVLFIVQQIDLVRDNGKDYVTTIGIPLDDVYIHCRYAENLIAGHGYSFNPPEQVSADTSPLWVVLIAAGGLLTSHLEVVAVILSSLSWLLLAPGVYRVTKNVFNFEELWARFAGILMLLNGRLLIMAPSGMETTLATLLALMAIEMHIRSRDEYKIRLREAVILGLGIATRPELFLLSVILGSDWLVLLIKKKVFVDRFIGFGIILGIFIAAILAIPYSIEGQLSFHSSIVQGFCFRFPPDFFYIVKSFWILVEQYSPIIFWPILVIGFTAFGMKDPTEASDPKFVKKFRFPKLAGRNAAMTIFLIGLPVLQGFFAPQYRHFGRYIFPLFPIVILGVTAVGRNCLKSSKRTNIQAGHNVFLERWCNALWLALFMVFFSLTSIKWIVNYGHSVSNINDQHLAVAAWVNENATKNDIIAADDVGAFGYFTKRNIVDLTGLVTPEIFPLQHDQKLVWQTARMHGANLFVIYTRLNPSFYTYAKDSLELVQTFPIREPLVSSADSVMTIFRVKGTANAAR
ncbi:MAG TPA: hypothetical protein VEW28_00615 [Candidatus Kapabacteria bacterium]|nr:hypothetical protein [Candidatus Kapabacteria bacterium]